MPDNIVDNKIQKIDENKTNKQTISTPRWAIVFPFPFFHISGLKHIIYESWTLCSHTHQSLDHTNEMNFERIKNR